MATVADGRVLDSRVAGRPALARNVALGLLLLVLLFMTAYPMAMLLYGSLHTAPPGTTGAFSVDD